MATDLRIAADFEPILQQLAAFEPIPSISVADARARSEAMDFGEAEVVAAVRDIAIPAPSGAIPARLYVPEGQPEALVLFYHGGGWVLGSLGSYDKTCRGLARRAGCAILSVDYRLAPEHPFPAAVDDALAALRWVRRNRADLPCPDGPVIVAGDSAGGNLAAATALLTRRGDVPAPDGQFLIYPVTDAPGRAPSYAERAQGGLLTAADMDYFFDRYAPDPAARADPRLAVRQADDLAGLPPAVVVTAEFDPLRDEGVAYAEALDRAGVPATHLHFGDQPHGFVPFFPIIPSASAAFETVAVALRDLARAVATPRR